MMKGDHYMHREVSKRRVALDLDDVLADLIGELVRLYRTVYCIELGREDVVDWNTFPPDIHRAVQEEGGYERLSVIPGADDFMVWLAERSEIHIVTYRHHRCAEVTLRWLERNLPPVYEDVHFAGGPKVNICRALGVKLLIDDSVNQLPQVTEELDIPGILIDTPMNRWLPENGKIKRASNFFEAQRHAEQVLAGTHATVSPQEDAPRDGQQ